MTGRPDDYRPSDLQAGGSRLSTSMLATYARCKAEFFFSYLCPHPTEYGLDPEKRRYAGFASPDSDATVLGSAVHYGLERYRRSGWRDGRDTGDYQLELGVDAALTFLRQSVESLSYPDVVEELCAQAQTLVCEYDRERPNGFLDWRLLADPSTGEPLTEREYAIPILGGRFLYTVKADALVYRTHPYPAARAVDYKTKGYRFVSEFTRTAPLLGQGWGEAAVLHVFFPNLTLDGRPVSIDGTQFELLVKDRGSKSSLPTIEVCDVPVSPKQAHRWLSNVERWALEISWAVEEWRSRTLAGEDPYEVGAEVFPSSGQLQEGGTCARYGRQCEFAQACEHLDVGPLATLAGLAPRSIVEVEK
jgi:hypothetical protein